jgi:hypothetical protein
MTRLPILLATILLLTAVLWLAGERHIDNCRAAGQTACTVLPWSGKTQVRVGCATALDCARERLAR